MKTIKLTGYLFYRYYSKGSRANFPYFRTICSMTLLGYIHLIQLLVLLNKVDIIPINSNDDKLIRRLIMFFIMLPIYLLMSRLFRKEDIQPLKEKYDKNWDKIFLSNVRMVIYMVLSFALMFALIFLKK